MATIDSAKDFLRGKSMVVSESRAMLYEDDVWISKNQVRENGTTTHYSAEA